MNYNELYDKSDDLFGEDAISLVEKAIAYDYIKSPVLDLGCGQGRNILGLIKTGYDVIGIDKSKVAIEYFRNKLNSLIGKGEISLHNMGIEDYILSGEKTILFIYVLHFLGNNYKQILEKFLQDTSQGGVHIVKTFLDEGSLDLRYGTFKRGELLEIYKEWEIKYYEEVQEFTLESRRTKTHLTAELIAVKK